MEEHLFWPRRPKFMAPTLLARRAVSREVGEKLMGFIHWWENHARQHNATIDNNPSYGNREGGLTTIYEKSLGAVAKGGQSPLEAVYGYAEPITSAGFCFMDTPGFDPVSMTGLVWAAARSGCLPPVGEVSMDASLRPASRSPPTRLCTIG